MLTNVSRRRVVVTLRVSRARSGRPIHVSPKCTAHIGIRGFRAIYAVGTDGFTSIERGVARPPAVSPISIRDASRPPWPFKDRSTVAVADKYLSHAVHDHLFLQHSAALPRLVVLQSDLPRKCSNRYDQDFSTFPQ